MLRFSGAENTSGVIKLLAKLEKINTGTIYIMVTFISRHPQNYPVIGPRIDTAALGRFPDSHNRFINFNTHTNRLQKSHSVLHSKKGVL